MAASAQQLVSSTVTAVHLSPKSIQERDGVTFYGVDVIPRVGGQPRMLMKRYNDFVVLRANLRQTGATALGLMDAKFPRKHLFGCKGVKLETRRSQLEGWLQAAISKENQSWEMPLYHFLGFSDVGVSQLPVGADDVSEADVAAVPTDATDLRHSCHLYVAGLLDRAVEEYKNEGERDVVDRPQCVSEADAAEVPILVAGLLARAVEEYTNDGERDVLVDLPHFRSDKSWMRRV